MIAALFVRGHRNQLDRDRDTILTSLSTVPSPDCLLSLRELQSRFAQWSLSEDSIRLHREATLLKSSISRVMNTSLDSLQEYTHQLSSSSLLVWLLPYSRTECDGHGFRFDLRSCSLREIPSPYEEYPRSSSSRDVAAILLVEAD